MTNFFFQVLHITTSVCFGTAFFLTIFGKHRAGATTGVAGLLCLTTSVTMIILVAERMPLYGTFESVTTVLWAAAGCFFLIPQKQSPPTASAIFYAVTTLMSGIIFFQPISLNHDFFMYASWWVQSFFFFKLLAAGIFLYAGTRYTVALSGPTGIKYPRRSLNPIIMYGTVLFLCSEFSGSVWCLKGWGDSWRWSGNFFQSAATFFIIMLNLHIPANMFKVNRLQALGTVSSFTIVGLLLW